MIEYIMMGYLSSLYIFEWRYILGVIIGFETSTSFCEEQKTLLTNFDRVTDMQIEEIIRQGTADDFFKRAFILYIVWFLPPYFKDGAEPEVIGGP